MNFSFNIPLNYLLIGICFLVIFIVLILKIKQSQKFNFDSGEDSTKGYDPNNIQKYETPTNENYSEDDEIIKMIKAQAIQQGKVVHLENKGLIVFFVVGAIICYLAVNCFPLLILDLINSKPVDSKSISIDDIDFKEGLPDKVSFEYGDPGYNEASYLDNHIAAWFSIDKKLITDKKGEEYIIYTSSSRFDYIMPNWNKFAVIPPKEVDKTEEEYYDERFSDLYKGKVFSAQEFENGMFYWIKQCDGIWIRYTDPISGEPQSKLFDDRDINVYCMNFKNYLYKLFDDYGIDKYELTDMYSGDYGNIYYEFEGYNIKN